MPIFIMISKHSPEACPMFNAKNRKVMMEVSEKFPGLAKKHGVKLLGEWTIPNEHLDFGVYEAPSLDAFMKLGMEPAIMALSEFLTYEIKIAMSSEEVEQMLKHAR